jgi:hypothetical protein
MKTIEEKACEYAENAYIVFPQSAVKSAFIAGYNAAQEWISVEDELPKEHKFGISKDVLTLAGSKHSVKNYDHIIKQWSGSQNITVTHWRPINND